MNTNLTTSPTITADDIDALDALNSGGLYLDESGDTYTSGGRTGDYLLVDALEWDSQYGDLDLTLTPDEIAEQLTSAIAATWTPDGHDAWADHYDTEN